MGIFKVNQIVCFFILISFAVAQEIKSAVPDKEGKLNLECKNNATISFPYPNLTIWTDSLNINCPNRSIWTTVGVSLLIIAKCHTKQNCSIVLTNITIANCTDFRKYLNVKYTCVGVATTTEITTTKKSDDDDDDNSEEQSTTSTTTTKKPTGRVRPHYLLNPVPGLLTTPHPTKRPSYVRPLLPAPILRPMPQLPPLFGPFNQRGYNNGYGGGFNAPIILPMPLLAPIPIPIFG